MKEKEKYTCPKCKKSFWVLNKDKDIEGLRCPFDCGYYSHKEENKGELEKIKEQFEKDLEKASF